MRVFFILILTVTLSFAGNGQNFSISGIVKDHDSHQPISFATVTLGSTGIGTTTNEEGKFSLSIPTDKQGTAILVSYVGYQTEHFVASQGKSYYRVLLNATTGSMEEVVVTGVSRATLARENPIPIVSVSARKMEQATESNLIDVLAKNVPGLNAVKTGPNISKPFIRGLGYNRVLTLIDGIRQEGQQWGDEHGIEVDPYNVERAEVVKGPSSLIYGSDALAGVVGLIPASPGNTEGKVSGKLFSEYQANNGLIGNGLRLSYGNDHWSYALSGAYRIAKNYRNSIDGRVYNTGFEEKNAAGCIKYRNSKGYASLNLTLYDNSQGIPDGSRDSLSRRFTYQDKEGTVDVITARPVVPDDVLNSYGQSPLNQHIQHYRIYAKDHFDAGKGTIDVLAAFQHNVRREFTHPTLPTQAGMYVRLNTVNYGFNFNMPVSGDVEISMGVNGMYQNNISKDATDFPIPDYNLFDAGAFGFAKWKHDKWTIGAGIRYDQRNLSGNDFYTKKDTSAGFDSRVNNGKEVGAYLQFAAFSKTFHGLSLSLGSTYAMSDRVSLKANIARGYRAPSIPEFSSNGLDPGAHIIYLGNRNFVPEFSLQEDLGIDIYGKAVSATVSVFNNDISNYIYLSQLVDASGASIVDAQGNKTFQYQQAKAQLFGMEATLGLHPAAWKGFLFSNSLALTYGINKSDVFNGAGKLGEYLPLLPPLHFVTSVAQDLDIRSDIISSFNFNVDADFNAAQSRYLALNNTETYTPAFTLINMGVGATVRYAQDRTMRFQFQVNNLLDRAYQSNLNRLKYFEYYASTPNGRSGIYNMGRNICLKVIVPF
jgi:iron complex outermembrane recepter protein